MSKDSSKSKDSKENKESAKHDEPAPIKDDKIPQPLKVEAQPIINEQPLAAIAPKVEDPVTLAPTVIKAAPTEEIKVNQPNVIAVRI